MKKEYIAPCIELIDEETEGFLAASVFDSSLDSQEITTTEEEYDGEFSGRAFDMGD